MHIYLQNLYHNQLWHDNTVNLLWNEIKDDTNVQKLFTNVDILQM